MNAWYPITDRIKIVTIGKAMEELGELQNILARALIQGLDERDPTTNKVNRLAIQEEISDVMACTSVLKISYL